MNNRKNRQALAREVNEKQTLEAATAYLRKARKDLQQLYPDRELLWPRTHDNPRAKIRQADWINETIAEIEQISNRGDRPRKPSFPDSRSRGRNKDTPPQSDDENATTTMKPKTKAGHPPVTVSSSSESPDTPDASDAEESRKSSAEQAMDSDDPADEQEASSSSTAPSSDFIPK